ncbi:MAG: DUF1553 domain-containing protein [Cyclobacteriaceae bacterium]
MRRLLSTLCRPVVVFTLVGMLTGCSVQLPEDVAHEYNKLPGVLDFNVHVKPILSDKCFVCHGPDMARQQAGLRLDMPQAAYGELPNNPGKVAIKPGNLNGSEAYHRIFSNDPEFIMPAPKSNLTLTNYEKAVLAKWIEDGAEYKPHWAFLKPETKKIPKVELVSQIQNPIDNFVLKKLETLGLSPAQEAAKEILLRRVSFDLTGLPPTAEEITSFVNDNSANAYEKQVDRLLASPHYGEKMATDWMDLSRYSDTHGYQVDRYRDVSPWRDWVIRAFNQNMGYDQFIKWQLAGDLLPNPTREQVLATTFNRLHPQNLEGGIIDEEFRVEYVADRASVVGQGMMALTVACAKCHDHKYDPISQKNFYELYSFFNNINETGQIPWEMSMPTPNLLLPTSEQEELIAFLEKAVVEKEATTGSTIEQERQQAVRWIGNEEYKSIPTDLSKRGLLGRFELNGNLKNSINLAEKGKMDRPYSKKEVPDYVDGHEGEGLLMNGENWFEMEDLGIFQRKDPFSIGLWVNVPDDLKEGVIFHKNKGTMLHAYRGYHLYLKDNKLELMLSHTWPDNAIMERTIVEIPKDEWVHVMLTYDGSSKAAGVKIYMNGSELETEVVIDNLYKDIIFFDYEDQIYPEPIEPGLHVAGRWRGIGLKNGRVDDVLVYGKELTGIEVLQIADPDSLKNILSRSSKELSSAQKNLLENYYLAVESSAVRESKKQLIQMRDKLFARQEEVQEIMVMKEMEVPRQAYILERGQYDAYGEEVFPNVPESVLKWKEEYPKNRLGLALWLTDPDHPLTARVAVNRYWQNYFGRGIVRTTEDFGNQGELPSHPELLDWLALEFIQSGWDVKALQKLIVMSATYRQSSQRPAEVMERDPSNTWLARGPKVRLTSEMMRDNALVASGLLNRQVGGPSVKPYQPAGLWKMNGSEYVQDSGDKLYRRSLYTVWKRTVPHPTLSTFDQPERTECTVRRQKTNTPLQALVLLNDPTYLETSKVIGETITREGASKKSIAMAYKKITGKDPEEKELDILKKLQSSEYRVFKENKGKAKGWLEAGEYEIDRSLDTNMVAANAVVASVIINSDASITKR